MGWQRKKVCRRTTHTVAISTYDHKAISFGELIRATVDVRRRESSTRTTTFTSELILCLLSSSTVSLVLHCLASLDCRRFSPSCVHDPANAKKTASTCKNVFAVSYEYVDFCDVVGVALSQRLSLLTVFNADNPANLLVLRLLPLLDTEEGHCTLR